MGFNLAKRYVEGFPVAIWHRNGAVERVELYPFGESRPSISIYAPDADVPHTRINWFACGAVTTDHTRAFLSACQVACRIADRLKEGKQP